MTSPAEFRAYAVFARPAHFVSRSGLEPLAEAVGATKLTYRRRWAELEQVSWTLGSWLRRWGQAYFHSPWNDLVPVWDEWQLARRILSVPPSVVHFLFAEFAGARWTWPYRRRGAAIVGTFHASLRRQATVNREVDLWRYDQISVVASVQKPFFLDRGYPADRLHLTLHGVDTDYFRPASDRSEAAEDGPLKGLLVGATERDHDFAARLMSSLPPGILHLQVATRPALHACYQEARNTTLLPHQTDDQMLAAYQQADLLLLPLLDSTANNALLESMACGTPVMTNDVGGVLEYVNPACNIVMPDKNLDEWADRLTHLASNREQLASMRLDTRRHVETLGWPAVAPQYVYMYRRALEMGPIRA